MHVLRGLTHTLTTVHVVSVIAPVDALHSIEEVKRKGNAVLFLLVIHTGEEEEVGISYGGHSTGRVGMRVSSPFPSARYGGHSIDRVGMGFLLHFLLLATGHSTGRVCNAVFMLYVTMAIALD